MRSKIAIDRGLGDRETVRVPKNRHPRPSAALPDLCLGLKSGKILGHCTLLTLGIGTDTAGAPRQCRDSHRPRSIRIKLGINRGLVDLAKKACWCKSVRGVVANRWICRNGRSVRIIWSPLNLSKRRPDLGPATPSSPTFLPSSRRQSPLVGPQVFFDDVDRRRTSCYSGMGSPPDVRDKIFNPLFTTGPAGEGNKLGWSMPHDIIAKQHGGRIDVDTEPCTFTEFIVTLERKRPAQGTSGETK